MTTTLTPRAPTPGTPPHTAPRRHPAREVTISLVTVLAGVLVATPTTTDGSDHQTTELERPAGVASPTDTVQAEAIPADPALAPPRRLDRVPHPKGEHSRAHERLAPQPPADRRDAPDPAVVPAGDQWALFSTQVGLHNVPMATSPDLRNWSPPNDALPQLPAWAEWGRTWAPGVTRLGGRYLLYFAAHHRDSGRQCIGVATSAAATIPFASGATDPLVCQTHLGGSIDPHPFVDADGTPYLLWKADGNAIGQVSTLFAQRLAPDGLTLTGQPVPLVRSDAAWEHPLIENPALVAADRSYLLLYSGGWWESAGYAIGYATCRTPLGPCTKGSTEQPLLASNGDQAGPGGATIVRGPAGDQWLAYHAWNLGAVGYNSGGTRSLRFAALTWSGTQPVVKR